MKWDEKYKRDRGGEEMVSVVVSLCPGGVAGQDSQSPLCLLVFLPKATNAEMVEEPWAATLGTLDVMGDLGKELVQLSPGNPIVRGLLLGDRHPQHVVSHEPPCLPLLLLFLLVVLTVTAVIHYGRVPATGNGGLQSRRSSELRKEESPDGVLHPQQMQPRR